MVKVFVIGDPHIKKNNAVEVSEMITSILSLIDIHQPDIIVNLGDTLDQHSIVHTDPLNRALKFIVEMSKLAPVYMLIGNHDLQNNNSCFLTHDHAFNSWKYIPNVTIVDTPMLVEVKGCNFIMCPYVYPGKLFEALSMIKIPENKLVSAYFLHQELKGVKLGIIDSVIGDEWKLTMPLAISGHIHDYQRPQDNIVYVGVPIQHSFGDDPNKTVSLFTFIDKDWKEERLQLNTIKKIIVHLSPGQLNAYQPPENKLVRIVVTGTSSEIKVCSRLDVVSRLRMNGVKIVFKITDTTITGGMVKSNPSTPTSRGFMNTLQRIINQSEQKRNLLLGLLRN